MSDVKSVIESGRAVLGIEFGSTRIKAVLIGEDHAPIATGAHDWENMLVDGIWTYSLDMIWEGISDCYSKMAQDAKEKYGVTIKKLAAIGISGMMHGYLPFDKEQLHGHRPAGIFRSTAPLTQTISWAQFHVREISPQRKSTKPMRKIQALSL